MMTFGTIGAFGFDDIHPPTILGLYRDAGCTVLQAYRNPLKNIPARDILTQSKDIGLKVDSIHAHFGDDLDPSSEDEKFRAATTQAYKREADYCLELGCKLLVIHPSPAHVAQGDLERRYAQLRKSFAEYAKIGEQTGAIFAFENMPPYHPIGADVQRLNQEIVDFASPHVVFMLDFGHAHMTCGIAEAIQATGATMKYTHVHDNDGVNDTHKMPYNGTLPWDACRDALHTSGYNGVFLLEVFEKAEDMRKMMNDEWRNNMRAIIDK
jgi:sugar phosphate isomerase/epimerase